MKSNQPIGLNVIKGFGCLIAIVVGVGTLLLFVGDIGGNGGIVSAWDYATNLVNLAFGFDVKGYAQSSARSGKLAVYTLFFLIVALVYLGITLWSDLTRKAVIATCVVLIVFLFAGISILVMGAFDGWYVLLTAFVLFAPPAILGLINWKHIDSESDF